MKRILRDETIISVDGKFSRWGKFITDNKETDIRDLETIRGDLLNFGRSNFDGTEIASNFAIQRRDKYASDNLASINFFLGEAQAYRHAWEYCRIARAPKHLRRQIRCSMRDASLTAMRLLKKD